MNRTEKREQYLGMLKQIDVEKLKNYDEADFSVLTAFSDNALKAAYPEKFIKSMSTMAGVEYEHATNTISVSSSKGEQSMSWILRYEPVYGLADKSAVVLELSGNICSVLWEVNTTKLEKTALSNMFTALRRFEDPICGELRVDPKDEKAMRLINLRIGSESLPIVENVEKISPGLFRFALKTGKLTKPIIVFINTTDGFVMAGRDFEFCANPATVVILAWRLTLKTASPEKDSRSLLELYNLKPDMTEI